MSPLPSQMRGPYNYDKPCRVCFSRITMWVYQAVNAAATT